MSQRKKSLSKSLVLAIFLAITTLAKAEDDRSHKKRQIYREQVLPHAGGRIPDTAFETDRLFLNRLQKEGIAVPDGVILEQRNPQVYPFEHKSSREVFHIALSSDGRYTSKEGSFSYNHLPTIETTYLYPQIHGHKTSFTQKMPAYPIYRPLQVHNPQLNQPKFQPKKQKSFYYNHEKNAVKGPIKPSYKTTSYQNFNLISFPAPYKPQTASKPNAAAPQLTEPSYSNFFTSAEAQHSTSYQPKSTFSSFDDIFQPFEFYSLNSGADPPSIDLPATGFGAEPGQLLY